MAKLSVSLPKKSLLSIYKSCVRPHLNNRDILYEKPKYKNLKNTLEKSR